MKLNAIRDFLAVAESGGLRAAARHLELPQPAITRSIQELEKELGTSLFERGARGTRLTPIGQAFLRRASAVRSELQRARDEIDQLRGQAHGALSVCLSSASHMALLPEALTPFRARYPDVKLELIDAVFPIVQAALIDGTIDCFVGPVPERLAGELQAEKLFDNTRVIVGRKGHPLAAAGSLADLAGAEWITSSITPRAEEELGPLFAQHGLPAPRLVLRAQSTLTYLTALVSSDLLMMVPVQWLEWAPCRAALHWIAVRETLPAQPICIVQRTGLPLTPAAEYFCDMLRRAAAQMQAPSLLHPNGASNGHA